LYEGGLRVPLIVRWPNRIAPGRVVEQPVSLLDVMPTLLEVVGLDPATTVGPLDGQSQRQLWLDGAPPDTSELRTFYWHLPHYTNQGSRPSGAIRRGKWKGLFDYEATTVELYDLESDPGEFRDVAEANSEVVQELRQAFGEWKTRVAAQPEGDNPALDAALHRQLYLDRDPSELRGGDFTAQEVAESWKEWRSRMNRVVEQRQPKLKSIATIRLPASQALVHGQRLRFEPEPHKNVLGYWTEVDDWAEWEFESGQEATVRVQIQCGCGSGNGGSNIDVVIESEEGSQHVLPWTVRETGHFQHMVLEDLGAVRLTPGKYRLKVIPRRKAAAAVVDIREVMLLPE
jgi:hypothetical protein